MSQSSVGVGAKFSPLTNSDVSELVKVQDVFFVVESGVYWFVGGSVGLSCQLVGGGGGGDCVLLNLLCFVFLLC